MAKFYEVLAIEEGRCPPDCSACEQACTSRNNGSKGIKVIHLPEIGFHGVTKCNQCAEPACLEACITGAITRSETDGVTRVTKEKCVGCGLCTLACPNGAITLNLTEGKNFTCDYCGGNPKCVEACKHGVLTFPNSRSVADYLHEDIVSHGISSCQGCGLELATRFALRVLGKDIIVFSGPGCSAGAIVGTMSGVPIPSPVFMGYMTNIPSSMTGVKRYYRKMGKDITCVAFVGDGLTADVGFQPLSGAAERGENLIYICLDNEAYMNTGIQSSGTTPLLSWTSTTPIGKMARGKARLPKNVPLLMAFHSGVSYVATATVAFPEDYARKLAKSKSVKDGLAYLHVLSPCPTGWRAPTDSAITLSRMAVETNYFPLWEAEHGKFKMTYRAENPRPIQEFTRLMGRFSHLKSDEIAVFQELVDDKFNKINSLAITAIAGSSSSSKRTTESSNR